MNEVSVMTDWLRNYVDSIKDDPEKWRAFVINQIAEAISKECPVRIWVADLEPVTA